MELWSYNKMRIEQEIVRKMESNRHGSKFEERGVSMAYNPFSMATWNNVSE